MSKLLIIDIKTTSFSIDGISVLEILKWEEVEKCFENIAVDLEKFYEKIDGDESLFFIFEAANWIRHDNIRSKELFELFLLEILKLLENTHNIKSITFKNGFISKTLLNNLSKKYYISFEHQGFKSKIQMMSGLYNFLKVCEFILYFCKIKVYFQSNKEKIDNVFIVNTKLGKRLGVLEDFLKKEGFKKFFYKENIKECTKEECMFGYMSFKSFFKSFYMTFKLKNILYKSTVWEDSKLVNMKLLEPSFYDLLMGQFYYFSAKDFLEYHRPKCIVSSGSLNKANSRRIFKVANDLGIMSINIIEKPFPLQSITMTVGVSQNSIGLAQHYIVTNQYHKNLLEKVGINKQIAVGYKGGVKKNNEEVRTIENSSIRLVLILGINANINYSLLDDLVSNVSIKKLIENKAVNLCIKAHPMQPIQKQEKLKTFLDKMCYTDVTKEKWDTIVVKDSTIGISPYSTAMAEFASYGGGVVWAPYYSLQSVIVDFMIHDIGEATSSKEELLKIVLDCVKKEKSFTNLLNKSKKNLYKYQPQGDLVKEFKEIYEQ